MRKHLLTIFLLIGSFFSARSEGTKELQPQGEAPSGTLCAPTFSGNSDWGVYGANDDERIHVTIKNFGERIYMGFGKPFDGINNFNGPRINNIRFRVVRSSDGVIVYGGAAGQLLPAPGEAGYIDDYNEAAAGPTALVGAAGYVPLSFSPTQIGDYYIEFSRNGDTAGDGSFPSWTMKYLDVTVASGAQIRTGRLWSKLWELTMMEFGDGVSENGKARSKFYAYTADSVVTTLDLNGMRPYLFTVMCNKSGVSTVGAFEETRKSVETRSVFAEYPLFLNNPDEDLFPSGEPAYLTSEPYITGCPTEEYKIIFATNKVAYAEILIDLDGNPGPNYNTEDVIIVGNLNPGENVISWDGNNGDGLPVPVGTKFTAQVSIISGLTNFPIYDAEFNEEGFDVGLERPAGSTPLIYYDDQNITEAGAGATQLDGEVSPGHVWTNSNYGDVNTINSWWYTYSLIESFTYEIVTNCPPNIIDDSYTLNEDEPYQANVLDNDSDPDLSDNIVLQTVPVSGPAHGTVEMNPDGTFTYTPTAEFSGTDSFVYEACDNSGLCGQATVSLTINAVNDAPYAINDVKNTAANTVTTGTVLANDYDTEGSPLTVNPTPVTPPAHGTLILQANGNYTYTPNNGYEGQDSFVYEVCDDGAPTGTTECSVATVNISIGASVNQAPTATNDNFSVNEGVTLSENVLTNDTDAQGDGLQVNTVPIVNVKYGNLTLNPDGSFDYVPNEGFVGDDSFTYEVCDDNSPSLCSQATVNIEVLEVNEAPLAVDDYYYTGLDEVVGGNLLFNDSDPDGNPISINTSYPYSLSGTGVLHVNANGTFDYTPGTGETGLVTFEYQVCDNYDPQACSIATVTLNIGAANNAPVAGNDARSTNEETTLNGEVYSNDYDPDGENLTFALVGGTEPDPATEGTLTFNSNGTYTFVPATNFNGQVTFRYNACDDNPSSLCDEATVTITVSPVNDAPVATASSTSMNEDEILNSSLVSLVTDVDDDTEDLTFSLANGSSAAANGVLTISSNGNYSYEPNENYNGIVDFDYQVCDDGNPQLCDSETITIDVIAVNDAPVAVKDSVSTQQDVDVSGNLLTNDSDVDGDPIAVNNFGTFNLIGIGTLNVSANGDFTFDPDANFTGLFTHEYQLCDNVPECVNQDLVIYVYEANTPVATDDTFDVNQGDTQTGNVLTNDFDPEGQTLEVTNAGTYNSAEGDLTINSDGTFSFVPNANFIGEYEFIYDVCDIPGVGAPSCTSASLILTYNGTPSAQDDFTSTNSDTPVSGNVITANDTDPENDELTIQSPGTYNLAGGTIVIYANGSYTYTPNAGNTTGDSYTYTVCDDKGACSSATLNITINAAPEAVADNETVNEDETLSGVNVSANDSDANDLAADLSYTIYDGGSAVDNGSLVFNPDGTYSYTPDDNFSGTVSFQYQVCDDNSPVPACDIATVTIDVLEVNDAPLADDVYESGLAGQPITFYLSVGVTDVDDTSHTYSIPDAGNLGGNAGGNYDPNTGEVNLTPNAGYTGQLYFTYEVCDDSNDCAQAMVYITVNPNGGNAAPIAGDDFYTVNEDDGLSGDVSENDGDPDDGPASLTYSLIDGGSAAVNGSLSLGTNGAFTYTPNPQYNGVVSFMYQVCDDENPNASCDNAEVTITVSPVNDNPFASSDANSIMEDQVSVNQFDGSGGLLSNDTDIDGDDLEVLSIDASGNGVTIGDYGTLYWQPDGTYVYELDNTNPAVQGLSNGATLSETFTYVVTDNNGGMANSNLVITINGQNDTPQVQDETVAIDENLANGTSVIIVDAQDGDNDIVNYAITSGNDLGGFAINAATGEITIAQSSVIDFEVNTTFTLEITVTDDDGLSDIGFITININDLNDNSPVLTATSETIQEGNTFVETVSANDADNGDTQTYSLTGVDAGLFSINSSTGDLSFLNAPDFETPLDNDGDNVYQLTVVVTDAAGNTDNEAITVTVTNLVEVANFTIDAISDDNISENSIYTGPTPSLSGDSPVGSVTYSVGGADGGLFTIDASTGVVTLAAQDFETPLDNDGDNDYEVTITATDADGNTASESWVVSVTDDNAEVANFTIDAISDDNISENSIYTGPTPSLSGDSPVGSVTYSVGGADGGLFTIDASTGVVTLAAQDFETPLDNDGDNDYEVTITATDADGNTASESWIVSVTDDNAEVANFTIDAISDDNISENSIYTGPTPSLSGDSPVGSVTYSVGGADGGLFTIDASTGVVTLAAQDFETPQDSNGDNDYEVTITATDADGNTASESWVVSVTDDNAEVANFTIDAISDDNISENSIYTGPTPSLSGDSPVGSVTYSVGGADGGLFTIDASTGVVTLAAQDFETPQDSNGDNDYEVTITATDADGNTASESWIVSVTDDNAEVANFTIDAISDDNISENSIYTGPTPSLSGDSHVGSVTYSVGGADGGLFTIDASTGVVTLAAQDFETPQDSNGDNDYEVTITATDADGNTASESWVVSVTDDNAEVANFTIDAISDDNISENSIYTGPTPSLSGDSPVGSVTYSVGGADGGLFTIDASTGVVTLAAQDFETPQDSNGDNDYEVTITATDADGNTASESWVVSVTDDNAEVANFTIDAISDDNISENSIYTGPTPSLSGDSPVGSVTYSVGGADGGLFTIDASTGVVTLAAQDFETPQDSNGDNDYEVTITATDADGNTASESWVVSVTDDNAEVANFTIDAISDDNISENSIYTGPTPSLSGDSPVGSVTYSVGGADGGLFTIDASTGVVTLAAQDFETPQDSNGDNDYEVTITATDEDGNTASESWVVSVTDDNAEVANFTIDAISDDNISENSIYTGPTPSLSGDSPVGSVTYSVGGADGGLFTIDASTGVVTLAAQDFETPQDSNGDNDYEVTITATDEDGNTASESWIVSVTDDNAEVANFTIDAISDDNISENSIYTGPTPSLSGDSPVGSVTYSVGGADGGLFTIDASTGVVTLAAQDFETPQDSNGDNDYEVTITATDADGNTASESWIVSVTDDNAEVANFTIDAISDDNISENSIYTGPTPSLSGDSPVGSVTYSVGGADGGLFTIDASTGVVTLAAQDFETPQDSNGDNDYEVTITATDADGNTASESWIVSVTDDNAEVANFTIDAISDDNISENSIYTGPTPSLSGDSPVGSVTYSVGGADGGLFTIDASTGVVTLAAQDFETPQDSNGDNDYEVTITATDADGNTASESWIVSVTDDNAEVANFTIDAISDNNISENSIYTGPTPSLSGDSPVGSVTYSVGGADGGLFTIDASTGVVTLAAQDFETPQDSNGDNDYEVTITATDADGNTASESWIVSVTDDNAEVANFTIDAISDDNISENSIYTGPTPSLSGDSPVGSVTYSVGGADGGLFTIDASTGVVTLAAQDFETPQDSNGDNDYEVTITATDEDGNTASESWVVSVTDDNAEVANFTIDAISDDNISENSIYTGPTPSLSGDSPVGSVTYSVGGADGGLFTIDASTGVVTLAAQDFETPQDSNGDNDYEVTITATDADGNTASESWVVSVTDDNAEVANFTIDAISDDNISENSIYTGPTPSLSGDSPVGSVTYSVGGADGGLFTIDASTGVVTLAAQDFETPQDSNGDNDYEVTITATDADGNTASESWIVSVTDDNAEVANFTIDAISDDNISENSIYTGPTPSLSGDSPVGSVTYSVGGADGGLFTIDASTGVVTLAAQDFETPQDSNGDNDYEVTITATDEDGNTASESWVVSVTDDNAEVANFTIDAISDDNISENSIYTGPTPSLSGDSPVGSVTYSVGGADGGLFTIDASTGVVTLAAQDFETPQDSNGDNDYEVTITATDEDGNTASESWVVSVTDDNAEVANFTIDAISDDNISENSIYTGPTPSLSGDSPVGSVTYSVGGADGGLFTIDASTGVVTLAAQDFETPQDSNGDNDYEVTITATDADGNTASESWIVSVTDDNAEVANFTIDAISDDNISENSIYTGPTPSLSGDSPVGSVTYSVGGADGGLFTIDASTGVVTLAAQDFETPQDSNGDNDYEVTITATDADGNTASESWIVSVTDDNAEVANFTIDAISDDNISENSIYTGPTPSLSGDSPVGSVTYSVGGADGGLFTIDASTGVVTLAAQDFETPQDSNGDNDYEVTITATDADGNTASESWIVSVTDDNAEVANFTIDAISDDNISENSIYTGPTPSLSGDSPVGSVTYSVGGADGGLFTIDASTGVVTLAAQDFETPQDSNGDNDYEVTITATDEDGNTASESWVVSVTDDNAEVANFTIDAISDDNISENSIYTGPTPSLSGDSPVGSVTYSVGGADGGLFTIDASTGVVTLAAQDFETPQDSNGDNDYEVTITATDEDGNTASESWIVSVTDDNAEVANFTIDAISDDNISENSIYTGPTPSLSGDSPVGSVTYSVGGADGGLFTIDASTGVVTLAAQDFETPQDSNGDNDYEVTITATDEDGNTASESWIVSVTDDNAEVANFTIDAISDDNISENSIYTGPTPSLSGDSPVGSVTYSVGGADGGLFTIDASTGVVTLAAQDFETPLDNDGDNDYEVTITATDADGNTASESWVVSVTDDNDNAPVLTVSDTEVVEGNVLVTTASVTDLDDGDSHSFSLTGDDASLFDIDENTGEITFIDAPDFENPIDFDGDNIYVINVVVVDDAGNSDFETIEVSVTNLDEAPVISLDEDNSSGGVDDGNFYVEYNSGDANSNVTDTDVFIEDVDNSDISRLVIGVDGIQDGSSEIITIGGETFNLANPQTVVVNIGTESYNVDYNTNDSTFNITDASGGGMDIDALEGVIATVQYGHLDDENPTEGIRTLLFTVYNNLASNTVKSDIQVNDISAPAEPTINSLISNNSSPTITGTFDELSSELFEVTVNGIKYTLGANPELTTDGNGNWALNLGFNSLTDGVYDVVASSTDANGNNAVDSTIDELIIDSVAPARPTVNTLVTNDSSPIITGTFDEANTDSLAVVINGITYILGVDTELSSDGLGNWSLNLSTTVLPDSTYDVVVSTTDEAGNTSVDATINELVIDTQAPDTPTVNAQVTNNSSPIITGTFDHLDTDVLIITFMGNDYELGVDTELSVSDSIWTLDLSAETLVDGTYEVIVSTIDAAGNSSADETSDELIINTSGPLGPTVNDQETNNASPIITGTFDEANTDSLTVEINGVVYTLGVDPELSSDGAGNWELDLSNETLGDGIYDVQVNSTDSLGNTSSDVTVDEIIIDTQAPAIPEVTPLTTNDSTPLIVGTFDEANTDYFSVEINGVTYVLGVDAELSSDGVGNWSLDLSGVSLSDGVYDITLTASDNAGNIANDITTDELVIDTSGPGVPTVDELSTNDSSPIITGTFDENAADSLMVTVDGVTYTLGVSSELTSDGEGNWTLDLSEGSLPDGVYDIEVVTVDGAGNTITDATTDELAIDTTLPVAADDLGFTVNEDEALTIPNLLLNDTDVEGTLEVSSIILVDPADTLNTGNINSPLLIDGIGSYALQPNGEVIFTPSENYNGPADINYYVSDNYGNVSNDAIIEIAVLPINDQPVAVNDTISSGFTAIDVLSNDYDVDGDSLILSTELIQSPTHGVVTIDASGNIVYNANNGFEGIDSLAYEVCDNGSPSLCSSAVVVLLVGSQVDTDGDGVIDVLDPDSDNDGIPDSVEDDNEDGDNNPATNATDSDEDGTPDYLDTDSDNDEIPDWYEAPMGAEPSGEDSDSDGIDDAFDEDEGGNGLNYEPRDTDADGKPDYKDDDDDDDGLLTIDEGRDGDCDRDNIPDYLDSDNCRLEPMKGFSPNDDGNLDTWVIIGIEAYPDNEVKIFNRWGNLVWETSSYNNDNNAWGGDTNGKLILSGSSVPDGTYFYVIDIKDGREPLSGYMVLKR